MNWTDDLTGNNRLAGRAGAGGLSPSGSGPQGAGAGEPGGHESAAGAPPSPSRSRPETRCVPILVGPTAVGKSAVALALAEKLGGEIVSADSRQIYRYMDIGTAKPSAAELGRIRHHFIGICDPDQEYSAGSYGHAARQCIDELLARGSQAVVAGGSGFYIRALVDGLFAPRASDPAVKRKWRLRIAAEGAAAIHAELARVDPLSAARLHPNDTQRVIRALEVQEITGQPISAFQSGAEESAAFRPLFFGLTRPREFLYRRINLRVEQMFRDGLLDEVRRLTAMGYGLHNNALLTVGYQEILECPQLLRPGADLAAVTALIQQHSRQYAKRQMTWFRRDERVAWIDLEGRSEEEIAGEIINRWETDGRQA